MSAYSISQRDHHWRRGRRVRAASSACGLAALMPLCLMVVDGRDARAQVSPTVNGPPVSVVPSFAEPGIPDVTIPLGKLNPFAGADGNGGGGGDGSGGDGGGGGNNSGGSDPTYSMINQSWGQAAYDNAQALGVNPSAVAATCEIESGCQNVGGPGTVAGAFQMTASTYTAMINDAIAANPGLANQIVPGLAGQMDPATESIAAAQYLREGAQYLQANGIANASVLDVRGYYNFGPQGGVQVATAQSSNLMSSTLSMYTAAQLAANGITPGETVGQWRQSVAAKLGNTATESVLM